MQTRGLDEIADGIYRISVFVPDIAPPAGFNVQPVSHPRRRAASVSYRAAQDVSSLSRGSQPSVPVDRLRWIAFGHFEADECGAMNEWLAVAPNAQLGAWPHGLHGSLNDMADRLRAFSTMARRSISG